MTEREKSIAVITSTPGLSKYVQQALTTWHHGLQNWYKSPMNTRGLFCWGRKCTLTLQDGTAQPLSCQCSKVSSTGAGKAQQRRCQPMVGGRT